MRKRWIVSLLLALAASAFAADAVPPTQARLALDDLFSEQGAVDAAVSPSGRYMAVIVRRMDADLLVLFDVTSGTTGTLLTRVGRKDLGERYDSLMSDVYWKSDDLMLFHVAIQPARDANLRGFTNGDIRRLGSRLFSIDRAGKQVTRMLAGNHDTELALALDLGAILSFLTRDPDHILMVVDGMDGRSLFKVNVHTGMGEVVIHADPDIVDWWLDLDGTPVVQVEVSRGYLRFYRRDERKSWKQYYKVRLRELTADNDYEPIGPSDQAGKFYVLARPEGAQRRGVYLYDLEKESFGAVLADNPDYDIFTAFVARDGKSVARYCYIADVRICETSNDKQNEHMKKVRKLFNDSVNVYVTDSSTDNLTWLLYVEGPGEPPTYYFYRLADEQIQRVGLVQEAMSDKQLPTATTVHYTGRDGTKLSGYLTRPPGAASATMLPLIMYPHGGPESRDRLTFDLWVQYFASLGYAVFQPNFRGSDGFGRQFAESGYGQWGRKMQDDISDALATLVEQKIVDPGRVCIVGASYGGYAALAGATLTPDLYKCVVSVAGIADLEDFLKARRKLHGEDSEFYAYWKRQIGDPETDAARIAAVSPAMHIDAIKAPILLIHGDDDRIVRFEQSKEMKKLLDKSGRPTQLIRLEDEGHSGWSDENERLVMKAIGDFVQSRIGPGYDTGNKP